MSTVKQNSPKQLESKNSEIPDWFYFVFGMMLVLFSGFEAKGQDVTFNNLVPSDIMVCEFGESFTVEFINSSSQTFSNLEISVDFPDGIEYEAGTLSESSSYNVQESDISNLSDVVFSANDLPAGGPITFIIDGVANYDGYTNQLNGNTFPMK